jgi:hypothetical protein
LTRVLFFITGLLACISLARSQEPIDLKIKTCISTKGMSQAKVKATRIKIVGQLKALGVSVVEHTKDTDIEDKCCYTPKCLADDLKKHSIDGIVSVHALRFGPMIQMTIKIYGTYEKKVIRQVKAKAAARNFPASASLEKVFDKALKDLQQRKTLVKENALAARQAALEKALNEKIAREAQQAKEAAQARKAAELAKRNEQAKNEPVPVVIYDQPDDSSLPAATYYWIGGSLIAGGAALLATGIYYLVGPMQNALDQRETAYQNWLNASEITDIERYAREITAQDQSARDNQLIGWSLAGAGAAAAIGGIITMLLAPDQKAAPQMSSFKPVTRALVIREGGGLIFEWKW